MNIYEATKAAIKKGCCITTEELKGVMKIEPTNGSGCCIVMNDDGSNPSQYGWQPTVKDLIATDWVITEEDRSEAMIGNDSVKNAKVIPVIQVEAKIGMGTEEDPVRNATQYWDLEGNLLAECDPLNELIPEDSESIIHSQYYL